MAKQNKKKPKVWDNLQVLKQNSWEKYLTFSVFWIGILDSLLFSNFKIQTTSHDNNKTNKTRATLYLDYLLLLQPTALPLFLPGNFQLGKDAVCKDEDETLRPGSRNSDKLEEEKRKIHTDTCDYIYLSKATTTATSVSNTYEFYFFVFFFQKKTQKDETLELSSADLIKARCSSWGR